MKKDNEKMGIGDALKIIDGMYEDALEHINGILESANGSHIYELENELEAINTIKDKIKSCDKQAPVKEEYLPRIFGYACPRCKSIIHRNHKFCYECGQHIDWDGIEDWSDDAL